MDTSKEYIKMCDCPEIQGFRADKGSFDIGDFIVAKEDYEEVQGDDWPCTKINKGQFNIIHNAWRVDDDGKHPISKNIWLPRQDQLQEMLYGNAGVMCCVSLANDISKFGKSLGRKHIKKYQFHSMEQLWLAFVMKEKFGKTWNGKEWLLEE